MGEKFAWEYSTLAVNLQQRRGAPSLRLGLPLGEWEPHPVAGSEQKVALGHTHNLRGRAVFGNWQASANSQLTTENLR